MIDGVQHLTAADISAEGTIIPARGKPVICLIYSDGCGHCVAAKPMYSAFARSRDDIFICAVNSADNAAVRRITSAINTSYKPENPFRLVGFPTFMVYANVVRDGNWIRRWLEFNGDRSLETFTELANQIVFSWR